MSEERKLLSEEDQAILHTIMEEFRVAALAAIAKAPQHLKANVYSSICSTGVATWAKRCPDPEDALKQISAAFVDGFRSGLQPRPEFKH